MKQISLFFIIVLVVFFSKALPINAQTSDDLDKQLTVTLNPETPGPNQDVSIEIESLVYDLSRADISWYMNDALRSSNVGQTKFSFKTGPVGSSNKIRYDIAIPSGVSFGNTMTITPGEVNLIAESLGYTPPFYKGKSLFSFEGTARVVAIPNLTAPDGTKYKPTDLVYTWKRGMGTDSDASGYGKNVFIWNGDIVARPTDITVEVSDRNNTVKATNTITIDSIQPEIYVYENDPLLGILFNKAIENTFNLLSKEVSFVAMPFYFNNPDIEGDYSWTINGNSTNETTRFITLRNVNNDQGQSDISVSLDNQKRIMQSAIKSFSVFMQPQTNSSSNLFQ